MTWLPILLLLAGVLAFLPFVLRGSELVRVRNAFLFDAAAAEDFEWIPGSEPPSFKRELNAPGSTFVQACESLQIDQIEGDWQRALVLGRHLLSAVGEEPGGPIQAGLEETYRRIVGEGQGYCADFVDVYAALALAAGLQVRIWAFSFDGFGGHGHTFNEVWDEADREWKAIDVYNNYLFIDEDGKPMSASAFHRDLLSTTPSYRLWPVAGDARPGFIYENVARDYYARGATQWYLWMGVNVFSVATDPVVRWLSRYSNMLAQLMAMARGLHPRILVVEMRENRAFCGRMKALRRRLSFSGLAMAVGAAALLVNLGMAGNPRGG